MSQIVVKCHVVQSSWPLASGARVGWSGAEAGVDGKAEAHRREAPPFSAHADVQAREGPSGPQCSSTIPRAC